jgi:hypothetical protein
MDWGARHSMIAMSVMALITLLNTGLGVTFISAGGSALAAAINGQNIFLLAGVEMILVLLAYVTAKHKPIPVPS